MATKSIPREQIRDGGTDSNHARDQSNIILTTGHPSTNQNRPPSHSSYPMAHIAWNMVTQTYSTIIPSYSTKVQP